MFKWASYYLQMPQQGWLHNVDGLQLVNVSVDLIGQQKLESTASDTRPCFLLAGRKNDQYNVTSQSKTPEESLYTFIIWAVTLHL
jgi:hypothetical protein